MHLFILTKMSNCALHNFYTLYKKIIKLQKKKNYNKKNIWMIKNKIQRSQSESKSDSEELVSPVIVMI